MTCQRCGRPLPEGSLFCMYCGKRLTSAPPVHRRKRRRPKGSGTVYQKKDENRNKPFVAVTGTREVLGHYATAGEAVQALDAYNAAGIPAAKLKMTFEQVYTRWSAEHYPTIGKGAVRDYENAYKKAESLHKRPLREVKREDYQQIIDALASSGLSYSTCNKQALLFGQMAQWAIQHDVLDRNYAEALRLPAPPAKKERTLTSDEIRQIKSVAEGSTKHRQAAQFALVLLYTGMRISELSQMERDNIHLADGYMVGGLKTETGKDRIIPILPEIAPILSEWLARPANGSLLLPDRNGKARTPTAAAHPFRALMAYLGIEGVTPHTMRHTAASAMVEAGMEPTAVQAILGHKSFSTTADVYTSHNDPAYLLEQMKKVAY